MKDFDNGTAYLPYLFLEFEDASSANEISRDNSTVISAELPVTPRHPPGGPGLDDIRQYLEPKDKVEEADGEGWQTVTSRMAKEAKDVSDNKQATKIVDIKLERSGKFVHPLDHSKPKLSVAIFKTRYHRCNFQL